MSGNQVQDQWGIQVYTISESSYDSIVLTNRVFPYWIISHVIEGKVRTETSGEEFHVIGGDVMLHPPRLAFSEIADQPGIHQWMAIDIQFGSHLDLLAFHPVYPVITLSDPKTYKMLFKRLLQIWNNPETPFREMAISAYVMQLVQILLADWFKQGGRARPASFGNKGDRFAQLIGYMSKNIREKLTREELAAFLHLNANYLDRVFMETYGVTPVQMLRELRLRRARRLLETTDMPLAAVADECGLVDAAHLTRWFGRLYGITPGKYREEIKSLSVNYL